MDIYPTQETVVLEAAVSQVFCTYFLQLPATKASWSYLSNNSIKLLVLLNQKNRILSICSDFKQQRGS